MIYTLFKLGSELQLLSLPENLKTMIRLKNYVKKIPSLNSIQMKIHKTEEFGVDEIWHPHFPELLCVNVSDCVGCKRHLITSLKSPPYEKNI